MAGFEPALGSNAPAVLLDNAKRLDELVNSDKSTVPDRAGVDLDTWRGMMAKNEALTEETRQNLIPLSRQYMTLADAQADIANIPVGSTTYYRSPDDSALAIEVMNVGGTLAATGREMPSQQTVINVNTALRELIDELPNDVLFLFSDSDGFRIADIALDQTGKPVLSLGRLSLSRNSGSVFDITDADGFTVSVDDLTNRVFQ
ncbi:flagellar biosynthesis protein, partial [Klebsiella pneumoniae]